MIELINISNEAPYTKFKDTYHKALDANQNSIEAINISSFSKIDNEVDSRFVNLKIVKNKNFIFFTNYNSPKSKQFDSLNQIAATFFWDSINVQIRMKALIKKTSIDFNQKYFTSRNLHKNALAISSNQSNKINSYEAVQEKFNKSLKTNDLKICPDYWGGFSFRPYYFEFWTGHESRINRRNIYQEDGTGYWKQFILEP